MSGVHRPRIPLLSQVQARGESSQIINGWSPLYMGEVLGSSTEVAPLALGAFGLTMMVGRLVGDWPTLQWGAFKLSVLACLRMVAGLGVLLLRRDETIGLLGFALTGSDLSVLAPLTLSAAGRHPDSRALAALTTMVYTSFLIGPAIMGGPGERLGRHAAFFLPLCLALLRTVLWSMRRSPRVTGTAMFPSPYSILI